MRPPRAYGIHRPEDNPTSVTVLRMVGPRGSRRRLETEEPYPVALARQRAAINHYAWKVGRGDVD